jgi:hypothetical protein
LVVDFFIGVFTRLATAFLGVCFFGVEMIVLGLFGVDITDLGLVGVVFGFFGVDGADLGLLAFELALERPIDAPPLLAVCFSAIS